VQAQETPTSPSPVSHSSSDHPNTLQSISLNDSSGVLSVVTTNSSISYAGKENIDPTAVSRTATATDLSGSTDSGKSPAGSNSSIVDLTEEQVEELAEKDYSVRVLVCLSWLCLHVTRNMTRSLERHPPEQMIHEQHSLHIPKKKVKPV
jgi:hypothetical protein